MIKTGEHVSYRGGNTEYQVYRMGYGLAAPEYTLISIKTGRKRYRVRENDLTRWAERTPVKAVRTSLGRVARPKNWKSLPAFAGGARRTWIGEKWVYKVGHDNWGRTRCMVEAARYAVQSGKMTMAEVKAEYGPHVADEVKRYHDVPVAECYLLEDGTLLMERVLPVRSLQGYKGAPSMSQEERESRGLEYGGSAVPRWSGKVDSEQIGLNRKGELVAYDL